MDNFPDHAKRRSYYHRGTFYDYHLWSKFREGRTKWDWSCNGNSGTEDTEEEAREAAVRWLKFKDNTKKREI